MDNIWCITLHQSNQDSTIAVADTYENACHWVENNYRMYIRTDSVHTIIRTSFGFYSVIKIGDKVSTWDDNSTSFSVFRREVYDGK